MSVLGSHQPAWLQDLVLDLRPEWGSEHAGHSAQIHAAIAAGGFLSSSISHSKGLGGFVASRSRLHLGLDIELIARVTPAIAARIAHPEDVAAPAPAPLWCAKESSFKALRHINQPNVISDIAITNWTTLADQVFRFQCGLTGQNLQTHSLLWQQANYFISVCWVQV